MERVEVALKSSLRKEMAVKCNPPAFLDDLLVVGAQNGVSTDDFSVDDLLDLPNDDVLDEEEPHKEDHHQQTQERASVYSEEAQDDENTLRPRTDFSSGDDFVSVPVSELSVPTDDLAAQEWLSQFFEDSFSGHPAPYVTGTAAEKQAWLNGSRENPVAPVSDDICVKTAVPAKARTKRARTGSRVWSLGSTSFTDSSTSSPSSSSSSTPSSLWLAGSELLEPVQKPVPVKMLKRKRVVGSGSGQQQPRRCSHCGVQKTPQWRAGPLGAKTLCNACGVRFKSGRLLPEYRPACSPTFSSELHSNSHRKVLEMRRKKEISVQAKPALDHPVENHTVVPSF